MVEEKEEEVEEEAGRGETRQRRVIDPEKGSSYKSCRASSGAAAAAAASGLQQPSTPGFSSFYNEPTPPRAQNHPAAANKGLDGALKGIPGGNRR